MPLTVTRVSTLVGFVDADNHETSGASVSIESNQQGSPYVSMTFWLRSLSVGDVLTLETTIGSTQLEELVVAVDGKPHGTHNGISVTVNPIELTLK